MSTPINGVLQRVSASAIALPQSPHALYRFFDRTDVLLYIGISVNLPARLRQHSGGKPWWLTVARISVEYYPSRDEALAAERAAIKAERPLFNDVHNDLTLISTHDAAALEEAEARGYQRGQHELAKRLLYWFNDEEIAGFAERDRKNAPPEDPLDDDLVNAIGRAMYELITERTHTDCAFTDLFRHLPPGLLETCQQKAEEYEKELNEGAEESEEPDPGWRRRIVAHYYTAHLAEQYLDTLPSPERAEWLRCATSYQPSTRVDRLTVAAAEMARNFKEYGRTPYGMCAAPGQHGATCTSQADWTAGIRRQALRVVGLCDEHLRQIVVGEWLDTNLKPFKIERLERYEEPPF